MGERLEVLFSETEVNERIAQIADKINKDYAGQSVHLVCALKGGVFFLCQLAKSLTIPATIDFISASSYGSDTVSSGQIVIKKDLDESIDDKNVIVVEDIVDTGNTLSYLLELLGKRNPASLKLCTLLDKPDRRTKPVEVQYTGFTIPDVFVVGYGLDYAQKYRTLPYIGQVVFEEQ